MIEGSLVSNLLSMASPGDNITFRVGEFDIRVGEGFSNCEP